MIAVAAAEGYAAASVEQVIEGTGVSRSSFYENFGDKAGCFAAALRSSAASFEAEVAERFEPSRSEPARLAGAIVAAAAGDPERARLVCVESLAAGAGAVAIREDLLARWESALLEAESAGGARLLVSPGTLLGGVLRLIAVRLLAGTSVDRRLGEELEAWWRSYRGAGGAPRFGAETGSPPVGGAVSTAIAPAPIDPGLGLEESTATGRRRRILAAVVSRCAEVGFEEMTIASVIERARISRRAFYEEFDGKEEALLAAHQAIFQTAMSACAGAFFGAGPWPERAWKGGAALLRFIDANPEAARVGFLEGPAISHASARVVYERAGAFAVFLAEGFRSYPQAEALPPVAPEALMATTFEWAATRLWRSADPDVASGHPELAAAILVPFLGEDGARAAIEEMGG